MWSKIFGVLIVLLALLLVAFVTAIAMNRPMLLDPPGFAKRLAVYLRYNTAETTDRPLLPELRLRRYRIPPEEMKRFVEQTVRDLPRWRMIRKEPDVGVYQVEVATPLWRFRNDVYIMVGGSSSNGTEVYLYSASRIGRGDLGANRAHILEFYEALERHLR